MYLSSLLMRRKHNAWLVALAAYCAILVLNVTPYVHLVIEHELALDHMVRAVALPLLILGLLAVARKDFVVRSDFAAFRASVRFATLILLVALVYGVSGFLLLDRHDFHRELSVGSALHYTIDQFDLTTDNPLQPYTRRAHLFLDSLSFVSVLSLGYVALSFFRPLKARFADQTDGRTHMRTLLQQHGGPSEDFFKLWPHDKNYFFNKSGTAGLAYRVRRGVALVLGDPVGKPEAISELIREFEQRCYLNDWLPAFVHAEPQYEELYKELGYSLQKIGEEAIVNTSLFMKNVAGNKYFRNITNRFEKNGYNSELLRPPHHPDVIKRLRVVSDEWLSKPGRTERGFVMGYFNEEYLQQCDILVARDGAGTIQAFLNRLPATFDKDEANFDMLRHAKDSLSNSNDFILSSFIALLRVQGYKWVNLGLSPLVGLEDQTEKTMLDNFLYLAYANGDRFYSFSGLHRFKNKYEPKWADRYIAYKGGLRGFTKTINALMRAMQVKTRP
jgi:phosphatidylglycerol lysyltransferase